jgi:hypothetical protein
MALKNLNVTHACACMQNRVALLNVKVLGHFHRDRDLEAKEGKLK